MSQIFDAGRRLLGLLFVALVAVPAFFVLNPGEATPEDLMRRAGAEQWEFTWGLVAGWWAPIVLLASLGIALVTRGRISRAVALLGSLIARPPRWVVAPIIGGIGAALTIWASKFVFDGRTVVNDASVQLIQARYFAAGHLSGPPLAMPEFWSIQFMIQTAAGWVSQYPPAHAAVLAVGFALGAPWVSMTIAMAVMGFCLTLSFERLLPERIGVARLAALLSVCSPLLLALAGSLMNHATVAAFAAVALYLALRAEDGTALWSLGAGAAVGAMVMTRPVSGLVIGVVVTTGIWFTSIKRHRLSTMKAEIGKRDSLSDQTQSYGSNWTWLGKRIGWWSLGGLPFAIAFGWFNTRFFGAPLRLGYVAASGPNHGLGFHEDPWGRMYGVTQAIGYTSAELVSLGRELLGTPFPIVALVGVFLLFAPKLTRGERIFLAWAALPVLASALYWHHDLIFGPRMLGEAVPAWCAIFVLAALGLGRIVRLQWFSDWLALVLLTVLTFGALRGAPERLSRHSARLAPRAVVDVSGPSLVFVHEPWADRVGGMLAGGGLRLDSVRTLLTRFHPCQLQASMAGLPLSEMNPRCQRDFESDSLGSLGLTNYLWLDDLPGLPPKGPLWARDLGPEENARLIEVYPDRFPLFLLPDGESGDWSVVPYDLGINTLWSPLPSTPVSDETVGGPGS